MVSWSFRELTTEQRLFATSTDSVDHWPRTSGQHNHILSLRAKSLFPFLRLEMVVYVRACVRALRACVRVCVCVCVCV